MIYTIHRLSSIVVFDNLNNLQKRLSVFALEQQQQQQQSLVDAQDFVVIGIQKIICISLFCRIIP